jgi:hypothetical protein
MSIALFRPSPSRRFAWLLWLALLLPLAQAAAGWHAHTHDRADIEAGRDDPRLAHLQACEQCRTLAALGGAAPGPAVPGVLALRLPAVPAAALSLGVAAAAPVLAYQGRAPPLAR